MWMIYERYTYHNVYMTGLNCCSFFFFDALGVWRWGSICRWAVDALHFICRDTHIMIRVSFVYHPPIDQIYHNVCMLGLNCCTFFSRLFFSNFFFLVTAHHTHIKNYNSSHLHYDLFSRIIHKYIISIGIHNIYRHLHKKCSPSTYSPSAPNA